jgi:CubicO group peptidase (beta-lactamase class C family)
LPWTLGGKSQIIPINQKMSRTLILLRSQMGLLVVSIILYLASWSTLWAQSTSNQIDRLIESYSAIHQFSGSVLVAAKGRVVLKKGDQSANLEWNIPNTSETRFRIGSITKEFTAVLILQLMEAGQLDLSAPLTKYLPYYRKDTGDRITIRHLLTHTSGLPDYTAKENFASEISRQRYEHRPFIEQFCSDNLKFEPGSRYSYSNSGYYLLGAIIEAVTHKTYACVLKEQILDRIGMKHTGVETPTEIVPERANGYGSGLRGYQNAEFIELLSCIFAAGAMYSTVEDLFLWDRALFGDQLLSLKSKRLMLTPYLAGYGYGIGVVTNQIPGLTNAFSFAFHSGAINGFRSMTTHVLNDDDVIILLSNCFEAKVDAIHNSIFNILHGLPYEKAKPSAVEAMKARLKDCSADEAVAFYWQAKTNHQADFVFANLESELNALGFMLMEKARWSDAVRILKLNVDEHPASSNANDSYAESLARNNQPKLAIQYYQRSLQLDPDNKHAATELQRLRHRNSPPQGHD